MTMGTNETFKVVTKTDFRIIILHQVLGITMIEVMGTLGTRISIKTILNVVVTTKVSALTLTGDVEAITVNTMTATVTTKIKSSATVVVLVSTKTVLIPTEDCIDNRFIL